MRTPHLASALLLLSLATAPVCRAEPIPPPKPVGAADLFGSNKDMVQLQTQVQQLLDAVARLQQSNDERMGVLKDLVQQSADSVNRLSVTVDTLQKQMVAQQQAEGAKVDTVSGQVQAINDSLDEIKARMNRLEKAVADVENQTQSINSTLQNQTPAAGSQPAGAAPAPQPPSQSSTSAPLQQTAPPPDQQAVLAPPTTRTRPEPVVNAAGSGAPPVEDLYKAAYGDYIAAKYAVATSEFGDLIKSYPDNSLAGNAFYYLGEIDYRAARYGAAEKDYDKVIEQFPDSNKIPAAHLHKGEALIALNQQEAGVRELRSLIQRYPTSPESTQARSRLNALGVPVRPRSAQ